MPDMMARQRADKGFSGSKKGKNRLEMNQERASPYRSRRMKTSPQKLQFRHTDTETSIYRIERNSGQGNGKKEAPRPIDPFCSTE